MSSYVAGKWLEDPEFELDIICIERGGTCIMFNSYLVDEDRDMVSAPKLKIPKLDLDGWYIFHIEFLKNFVCKITYGNKIKIFKELDEIDISGSVSLDLTKHTKGICKKIWNLAVAAEREIEKYLIKGGKI